MASSTISRGNQAYDTCVGLTMTPPASLPATTLTAATYTIPGLLVGDLVSCYIQSSALTYSINYAYVSAPNVLTVLWASETGGTVSSAPAVNVAMEVIRTEGALTFAQLPTSLS